MAGLLYFLSQAGAADVLASGDSAGGVLDRDRLADYGLAETLEDCLEVPAQCVLSHCERGPNGKTGTVLYPVPPDGELPQIPWYRDDGSQTWWNAGRRWNGIITADPPEPEDLERRMTYNRRVLRDTYGRWWKIPLARTAMSKYGALPCRFHWGPKGDQRQITLDARAEEFWELSEAVERFFSRDPLDHTTLDDDDLIDYVLMALKINYRVDSSVVYVLDQIGRNPLETMFVQTAALLTVDRTSVQEYIEKKETGADQTAPNGPNSGTGEPADCPTTAQLVDN